MSYRKKDIIKALEKLDDDAFVCLTCLQTDEAFDNCESAMCYSCRDD